MQSQADRTTEQQYEFAQHLLYRLPRIFTCVSPQGPYNNSPVQSCPFWFSDVRGLAPAHTVSKGYIRASLLARLADPTWRHRGPSSRSSPFAEPLLCRGPFCHLLLPLGHPSQPLQGTGILSLALQMKLRGLESLAQGPTARKWGHQLDGVRLQSLNTRLCTPPSWGP